MKVYKPLQEKNANGKFYEEYNIPDGLPIDQNQLIPYAPDANLKFPRYSWSRGLWVEDKDSIIEQQAKDNKELESRIKINEDSLTEMMDLIVGGK